MTDLEKLKQLTSEIDSMIESRIDPDSENFTSWKAKTERLLKRIYGESSEEYNNLKNTSFKPKVYIGGEDYVEKNIIFCNKDLQKIRPILKAYIEELEEEIGNDDVKNSIEYDNSKVLIVHGHDETLKVKVARLLEKQGIEAIILHEQSNHGQTLIEKLEECAEKVSAAICLFTPDDEMIDGTKRARQNVVFETGYCFGKIGRNRTIIIAEDETVNLSDLSGIVYVNKNNWELDVLKELKGIGFNIDFNQIF